MEISEYTKASGTYLKGSEVAKIPNAEFVITSEFKLVDKEYKGQKSEKLSGEGEMAGKAYILELSKTNSRTVEKTLGSDTKKWIGCILVLETYKTKTTDGALTDAINVKSVKKIV
jgi:hypothetical protein